MELSGKTHTNYTQSTQPTLNSFSNIDIGVFSTLPVQENTSFLLNYLHLVELPLQNKSQTNHLNIASIGVDSKLSTVFETAIYLTYQSYYDSEYSETPISIIGINPVLNYTFSPDMKGTLSGYWNSLDFGDLLTQTNPKVIIGTEIAVFENSKMTIQSGLSLYSSSIPSSNHNDFSLTGTYQGPFLWDLSFSTYWSGIYADYVTLGTQKDTTQHFSGTLTKDVTDTLSLFMTILHISRSSTIETRKYQDTSFQIGTSYQPQLNLEAFFAPTKISPSNKMDIDQLFIQAKTSHRNKDFNQAIPIFEQIILSDPTYVEAYYLLSYALIQIGNKEKAKRILTALYSLTEDPNVKELLETSL